MNIIFLDIDGVLNSVDSMLGLSKFEYNQYERLDVVSIGLLKRLCNETDAKIVISSTWRKMYSIDELKEIFSTHNWNNVPIIDVTTTERVNPTSWKRGYEIQHWLDNNEWTNYVIFDDDSDILECQSEHFIHVSNIHGFRSTHYCKALRVFGKPDDRLESQVFWKKE